MIQNITIRVPWSDNGWCEKVCNHPCTNTDCLRLKNIHENKNELEEEKIAGKSLRRNIKTSSLLSTFTSLSGDNSEKK
ncbi:hypothetical protein [Treponema sp.]|uniref:hypothetical protein n=1 Tax=Treponema sp. TaxID=166 RepID=UPI003F05E247